MRIGWEGDQLEKVCAGTAKILTEQFGQPKQRVCFEFKVENGVAPEPTPVFAGFEYQLDDENSHLIIGAEEGLLIRQNSKYEDRTFLLNQSNLLAEVVQSFCPELTLQRCSIAMKSTVPIEGDYVVNEWIRPNFEFNAEWLKSFSRYHYDVEVNLQDIRPGMLARVVVESATEGRKGIEIFIDVLLNCNEPIQKALELLTVAKNVESDIYEDVITKETRILNGEI